jgi:Tfp pilus assembly protein PilN
MPKILGVNLDSGSLSASLTDAGFRSVRHLKYEKVVLPDNREDRSGVMIAALTKWQKESRPSGTVIGLPLQSFSWRTMEMPSMKRVDMQKALFFELEKYLPLPMEEYLYDFLVIGNGETAPHMVKVLVFSIKKETLIGLLRLIKEAGMEILSARCSTIDILSGVIDLAGERNQQGIFVNVTDDAYEIVGLRDSLPVYMKRILKTVDLKDEIESLSPLYPGRIYVTGSVDQSVSGRFNSKKFQVLASDLLVSSYVKKTPLRLDFLPEEFVRKKKDYYPYIIGGVAVATLLVFLLTGLTSWYKDRHALTEIEAKIVTLKGRASGVIEAQRKLDLLQNDRRVLLDFRNKSNLPIRVVSTLSALLPPNAWLMSLSIDDKGKVEMEGFTSRTADFVEALEKSKDFQNISFSAPIIKKNNEERFALKMEVGGL